MSLLDFFPNQNRRWQQQTGEPPLDFLAGGLVALDQAETAWRTSPLYNAHTEACRLRRRLDDVTYKLTQARILAAAVQVKLTAANKLLMEMQQERKQRHKQTRNALRQVLDLVSWPLITPETKLEQIQELVLAALAALENPEPTAAPPQNAEAPLPLS